MHLAALAARQGASTLPAPPPPRLVTNGFAFPKLCKCCGRQHTAADWAALKYIGVQHFDLPEHESTLQPASPGELADEVIPPLEMRNCVCGSTLCVEVMP